MRRTHYHQIVAWAEGKKIEHFDELDCAWHHDDHPSFSPHMKYRIKPEGLEDWQQAVLDAYDAGKKVECVCYDKLIMSWCQPPEKFINRYLLLSYLKDPNKDIVWSIQMDTSSLKI
jgi:hypothetical protein